MAAEHARSGASFPLLPAGAEAASRAVVRDERLEVMLLNLPAGRTLPAHHGYGPCTLHCLSGEVAVDLGDGPRRLGAGELMYLAAGVTHAVHAPVASNLLVTLVLVGCTEPPAVQAPPGGEPRHGSRG